MEIQIRNFEAHRDLPEVTEWFSSTQWPHPPVDNLMPKFGVMAVEGDVRLACGFLYTTSTSKAELSWLNTNPKVDGARQLAGLRAVIQTVQQKAMELPVPIRLIEVISSDEGLKPLLKSLKFQTKSVYRATFMPPKRKKNEANEQ